MAKFKAGDAVKLRDDLVDGVGYPIIILLHEMRFTGRSVVEKVDYINDTYTNYEIAGWIYSEEMLEAWPESTEETRSNEIDPQLFELVKAALTGLMANPSTTYTHGTDTIFPIQNAIDVAKETLRLLREENQ